MCEYQAWSQKNILNRWFIIAKKVKKTKVKNFTLSHEKYENIVGEVFNSTCLPSGNLVDGLPLDLHNTDAVGY